MISINSDDFWLYSKIQYSKPGVEEYCLSLQNFYGGNVNILLFCSWLGCSSIKLSTRDIILASKSVYQWELDVVQSLRRARKFIPQLVLTIKHESIVDSLRKLELISERAEQSILCAWANPQDLEIKTEKNSECSVTNINKYLIILDAPILSLRNKLFSYKNMT